MKGGSDEEYELTGGKRRRGSRKSKKGSKKGSRKSRKSRRMSREGNPAFKANVALLRHLSDKTGVKWPVAMQLAKIYREKSGESDFLTSTQKAKKLFDEDSAENRKKNVERAEGMAKRK